MMTNQSQNPLDWKHLAVEVSECVSNVSDELKLIPPSPNDLLTSEAVNRTHHWYKLELRADFNPENTSRYTVATVIQREANRRVRAQESILIGYTLEISVVEGDSPETLGLVVRARRVTK